MPAPTPWKQAVTGGVGIVTGVALLSVDWTLAQVVAFVGLALVARGTLHLVTSTPFVGFAGAFAALGVAGDIGVGITLLAWPDPTTLTLALLVGSWAILRGLAGATIAVTTRVDHPWWLVTIVFVTIAGVMGAVIIARSVGPLHDTVVMVGLLALLEGTRDAAEAASRARHARTVASSRRRALRRRGVIGVDHEEAPRSGVERADVIAR